MYIETPNVPGTPESRIAALKESRELLQGGTTKPGPVPTIYDLISLATYIETGHDYSDLHPIGKQRPKITHQHITVMAGGGGGPTPADIEHLLYHLAEDLPDFQEKPEPADAEESAADDITNGAHNMSPAEREDGVNGK